MKDLLAEFRKFDEENPFVWEYFKRFAEQAIQRGRTKLSGQLIIERIRWEIYIITQSDDDFKINNNHTAYYVRKWLELYKDREGYFEIRRVRGNGKPPQ